MIPEELKSLNQWLCWNEIPNKDGTVRKIPVIAATGHNASSTDPATWCDFDMADACKASYTGLGFVFRPGGGIVGMDLDCCLSETGELAAWAAPVLAMFPTYAEVSPSGRGIKIWMRGDTSKATKCKWYPCGKPVVGVKHGPAVEMYATGRFFTVTGQRWRESPLEVVDCQSSLDFLISAHFTSPVYVRRNAYERNGTEAAFRRAEAYVSRIPGAVSGQSGHDATFSVACKLVKGFSLGYDDAMAIISDWNATCLPPWEDRDIERKIQEAISKSTLPEGFLLDRDERPVDVSGVNLDGLTPGRLGVITDEFQEEYEPTEIAPPFPSECLDVGGMIGKIMAYTLANSIYPQPELALAGALALMSTITGRVVQDRWNLRTNAYYLGLCDAGGGKGDARRTNSKILAGIKRLDLLAPTKLKSGSGVISVLTENPASLFQLDEMNRLLQCMKDPRQSPHLYEIGSLFLELYSEADNPAAKMGAYADRKKNPEIDCPHLVIYGTAVGQELLQSLTRSNLSDGLVGRLMAFHGRSNVESVDQERTLPDECLLYQVESWLELTTRPMVQANNPSICQMIHHTGEAWERYREHGKQIEKTRTGESKTAHGLWKRTAEKTGKLAILSACSRVPPIAGAFPVVELCDVNWAIKLSNWLTRNMLIHAGLYVAETAHEANLFRLLRLLDEWKSLSEIEREFRSLKPKDRSELLKHALDDRIIQKREIKTTGRPRTEFRRVGKVGI